MAGLKNEERLLVPRRALDAVRQFADAQESDTPIKIARDCRSSECDCALKNEHREKPLDLASASGLPSVTGATA